MRDPLLAARLAAFSIDEGLPSLCFAERLARENRWTSAFAQRAVTEYLRFLYLAVISSETVTPSVAVDQVWHLHLCYTRSYWHHLCADVLGRELHHGPTRGGFAENTRYHVAYERTLALYQAEFGQAAPVDLWPSSARRFAPDAAPVSVAPRDYLLLPKAGLRRLGFGLAMLPVAILGVGALALTGPDYSVVFGVVLFIGVIALITFVIRQAYRASRRRGHRSGSGCSAGSGGGSSTGCSSSGCSSSLPSGNDSSSGGDSGSSGDSGSGCGSVCGGD